MTFKCIKCGKCCWNTEMPLTRDDLKRITSLGYKITEFAVYNGQYWQLKNINGHCFFLNPETNECTIYPNRPLGCRIYPIIYIEGVGAAPDPECPMSHTVAREDIERVKPILLKIVMEIEGNQ